ncbi:MAG: LPS export ABC transporter periplasmic protein LptC [Halieaceae bacterium]|nr:LPS export ABC transporter periplasmic protein LptC [Halieaceae bacterium]
MGNKRIQTIILCIAAAIAWQFYDDIDMRDVTPEAPRDVLQTYLKNSETVRFDTNGQAKDSVGAEEIRYYTGHTRGELTKASISRTLTINESWSARAMQGTVYEDNQTVTLRGQVVLNHDSNDIQLKTERLNLDLVKDVAHTDALVTLTHHGATTQSEGLTADLKQQSFHFMHKVNSVYVPLEP